MTSPLADHIAGFKYRDELLCRSCVTEEEFAQARDPHFPVPETGEEGQFFPRSEVKGMGWECDRCGKDLEKQRG